MAAPKGNQYAVGHGEGRPEKPIDWKSFEGLCHIHCTPEEIAAILHISRPQLIEKVEKQYGDDFPTVYKTYASGGKMSLRRHQFKQAEKSPAMAIWMGKQYLGQTDSYFDKTPANDSKVESENQNMVEKALLRKENDELKATIANLSKTRPELPGIDSSL